MKTPAINRNEFLLSPGSNSVVVIVIIPCEKCLVSFSVCFVVQTKSNSSNTEKRQNWEKIRRIIEKNSILDETTCVLCPQLPPRGISLKLLSVRKIEFKVIQSIKRSVDHVLVLSRSTLVFSQREISWAHCLALSVLVTLFVAKKLKISLKNSADEKDERKVVTPTTHSTRQAATLLRSTLINARFFQLNCRQKFGCETRAKIRVKKFN